MAHYLLYFPKKTGADPKHFEQVGLGDLLRDGDDAPRAMDLAGAGPDDGGGQIWTWIDPDRRDRNPQFGYHPEQQTWQPAKPDPARGLPAGRYWYGWQTDAPPRPEDLARKNRLAGFDVQLGDGRPWRLPNVFRLPHRYDLDDDGNEARVVKASYADVYARGLWAMEQIEDGLRGTADVDWKEAFRYCVEMLAYNYRVSRDLVAGMHLLDEQNYLRVMAQTTDLDRIRAIQDELKKTAARATPAT